MRILIDVLMQYRFVQANTVTLVLEAAQMPGQEVVHADLDLGPAQISRIAGDSDVGQRIWARVPAGDMQLRYRAEVNVTRQSVPLSGLRAMQLHEICAEAAPYIRPSRYCQSDKFVAFVDKRFGHLAGGDKVAAIRDWIEANLSYVPGSSDSDTNVLETFAGRQGVCRDYAHLFCAMVRAAQIPARAVSAYGPDVVPQDFHALAEVWLEDGWHLVDPTGMCAPDAVAVIAVGRDAYDIAFMESQAPAGFLYQQVYVTRS
ncbi:transglutaminase family protein [Thioclava sp. BHET1]|uniref:Transglutaminase n=1 Tax=Thioclava dalianensis TaxID=1185766 RepID=A0A074U9I3_9RHOB|nr:transglutaminase family protein [Thioclava dalianensis]KEP71327.1 transglutaminase [Thioclava dalianensis]TMV90820.1 transglutaminase family protein [Thioclava sp. BHET1]SFM77434.1 Transglutaminase-like enzyme, putative cysteine protease [Thioclava dalianensis]